MVTEPVNKTLVYLMEHVIQTSNATVNAHLTPVLEDLPVSYTRRVTVRVLKDVRTLEKVISS